MGLMKKKRKAAQKAASDAAQRKAQKKAKAKWDDAKEGRKPWEAAPKQRPAVSPPRTSSSASTARSGPGSVAEDVIGELTRRNKALVDKYGEKGSHSSKKRKKKRGL